MNMDKLGVGTPSPAWLVAQDEGTNLCLNVLLDDMKYCFCQFLLKEQIQHKSHIDRFNTLHLAA